MRWWGSKCSLSSSWRYIVFSFIHSLYFHSLVITYFVFLAEMWGGSVAEWLACRTARIQIAVATLSGNSLRQTVHTHFASVHQAAKLVAALLRVAWVTAGLAESNGSLPSGLWFTSPAGRLPRTGISSGTLRSVMEYGLPLILLAMCTEPNMQGVDTASIMLSYTH